MQGDEHNHQAEMMIEVAASPENVNDTSRDSDESQSAKDLPQLTLNISIAAAQQNDADIIEKNVRNESKRPTKDSGKCCALDAHKGDGKRGKELNSIEANYLKVNIDKIVDRVYLYEVQIKTVGPKKLYTKVFTTFCAEVFPKQEKQIAFDDDKMIAVSPCRLDIDKRGVQREIKFTLPHIENDWKESKKSKNSKNQHLNKTWNCNVAIRPASKFSISLKRVLAGQDQYNRYDAIHALNTIFNSAYHQEHLNHGIQDGRSLFLKLMDELPDIKEHYELRSGLHQRILLDEQDGSICPLLNIDVKHRAFPQRFTSLIDLLHAIERETPRCSIDLSKSLSAVVVKKLKDHLCDLEICYKIDDMNNGILKFLDLGKRSAYEVMSKENGTTKMVHEYFAQRNLRIKYPYLQCIQLKCGNRHISVPMEYCSIIGDQLVQKKFSQIQSEKIKTNTIMKSEHRKDMIMHHLRAIKHNECETIRAFGLSVDESFASVPARQLDTPSMEYRDRKMIKPMDGEWAMGHGADQMEVISTSPTNFTWTILCTDLSIIEVKLKRFAKWMHITGSKHRIRLEEKPNQIVFAKFSEIKEKLQEMYEQEINIVICVIPPESADYDEIKFVADLDIGIMTQCIKSNTLENTDTIFRQTFMLNINAKLDGINQKLLTAPILKDFDAAPIMFIGAHLTSSNTSGQGNAPSIAGMVASRDRDAFRYNIGCTMKSTFRSNFMKNLRSFREENGCLPIKLIYFRNDESRCSSYAIIESERKDMVDVCNEVQQGHGKIVQITIIIVEPERHMRLFARSNANDGKTANVPPGTIFNTFLTQQRKKQFYMVSQLATEGVTRPTKYTIHVDEGNHCIYDLHELTFFMCHMFACCNRSVTFPAPIHHALRVAKRSQLYLANASIDANNPDNNHDLPVKVKGNRCI